jgi:hypothetical protein
MIRSRVLWAVFAVIISVSFVFTFSRSGGCRDTRASASSVGELYGKAVPPEEFSAARLYELGLRRNINIPPEAEKSFRKRVWTRLAALKTAEKVGLVATDGELASALQRDKNFAVDGQFNADRYRSIVRQQVGVTVPMFESYLRQELTLEKLRDMASGFAWSSPMEVRERVSDLADQRKVDYVVLDRKTVAPTAEVSREQAVAFYEANTNRFAVPERVRVAYVRFDVSNYLGRVELTDTNVAAYYDEHLDLYSVTGTNGETTAKPLADVRGDVEQRLRRSLAQEKAVEEAGRFAIELLPGRGTSGVPFDKAAAVAGLQVYTSGLFSASDKVPDIDVPAFTPAAFDLDLSDPSLKYSDVVPGSNTVAVLSLLERNAAFVPSFDTIASTVMPMAVSNATENAFREKVASMRQSVAAALLEGKSFRDAVAGFSLNVSTSAPFAVQVGLPEGAPYADALPGAVAPLDKGELSDPTPCAEGLLIAYVVDRIPAEPAAVELLAAQMQNSLSRYLGGMVYRTWADAMLADAGLNDRLEREEQPDEGPGSDGLLDL